MNEHLTEWDMLHYAQIRTMSEDNMTFIAKVNSHVFQCEQCKTLLDRCCEREDAKYMYNAEIER